MVTLGFGATAKVTSEISTMGSNLIWLEPSWEAVRSGARYESVAFEYNDCKAIEREVGGIRAVAPYLYGSSQLIYGNENTTSEVIGSTNDLIVAQNWKMDLGRTFTAGESSTGKAVCILGATVRDELFGGQNPVGASIRIKNITFRVIGVFESKGKIAFGMSDPNKFVLVPMRTMQRRITGSKLINVIVVSARDSDSTETVKEEITKLMRQRRRIPVGEDDTFNISGQEGILSAVTNVTQILTAVLGAIAAVSLLVGGIGIMNIMLVSVTERTREIGIRLSIGALEKNVLTQFLVEAMVLSSLGGLIGIVVGLSATYFISKPLQLPFIVSIPVIVLAFAFSAAVGIVFGFFPARKAARLDPIDALRHE
jgi:putative ABC transport system permease protein